MNRKTQVIVNPESNKGRTRLRWDKIKDALKSFIKEFKYEFTERPLQATEISRSAIKDGVELIVGVGGDGTINEIANGFYEEKNMINPDSTLGIFPSGTGCDLSRSLNIPKDFTGVMKMISEGPKSFIDIGRIKFRNKENAEEERFFLNITDFGIGGEVIERMNRNRAKKRASSYLKSLISTFLTYKAKKIQIKIDGKEIPMDEYMIGAVSNGRIFGKGMKIAPEAKLDDGLFDLILVKSMRLMEFLRNAWKLYAGTHLSHPKIDMIRGSRIEAAPVINEEKVLIEVDGEQVGTLPAAFEIIPCSFPVIGNP